MEEGFDKRALIAIVLAIIVLIGYQYFLAPGPPPEEPVPVIWTDETEKAPSGKTPETPAEKTVRLPEPEAVSAVERFITVETPLYKAELSSKGATIKGWQLKNYRDKEGLNVLLMKEGARFPALSAGTDERFSFREMPFMVEGNKDSISLRTPGETVTVSFIYRKDSVFFKRTYTFYSESYRVDITEDVEGVEGYWITLGTDFGISGAEGYAAHIGPVILKETDRKEIEPKKIKEPQFYREGVKWVAQEDKYFFSGIVPGGTIQSAKIWRSDTGEVLVGLNMPAGKNSYLVYSGPKEHDRLKALNVELEHIIDFGFFSILARPLFWILKLFYKFTGNYGWAIMLVTILVRVPFIPLINMGQKSMKKLQTLQPKMNEIKEKYKKDQQKMQKEMMELYKKYKVNPMSGCLPMLIQIPVFFALYKVLLIAIELRNAPFMLWIKDLSAKDPYYILPVVMGLTMFIQQKMTPSTVNTQQQKIMQYLPIIFTFLFLNFPSGLVLYWLVSNLLSIVQQYFVNKKVAREALSQ